MVLRPSADSDRLTVSCQSCSFRTALLWLSLPEPEPGFYFEKPGPKPREISHRLSFWQEASASGLQMLRGGAAFHLPRASGPPEPLDGRRRRLDLKESGNKTGSDITSRVSNWLWLRLCIFMKQRFAHGP